VSRRAPGWVRHLSLEDLLVALQGSIDVRLAELIERAEEVPRVLADDRLWRHTEPMLVGPIGELAVLGGVTVRERGRQLLGQYPKQRRVHVRIGRRGGGQDLVLEFTPGPRRARP